MGDFGSSDSDLRTTGEEKDAIQGFPSDASSANGLIIAFEPQVLRRGGMKPVSHVTGPVVNTQLR